MDASTAERTVKYIDEHPHIKHCLRHGLINYSALSRCIAKDLRLEKKSSHDAILVAARRHKRELDRDTKNERQVFELLAQSALAVKTKIVVFVIEKGGEAEDLEALQAKARKEGQTFFLLEGTASRMIIAGEEHAKAITPLCKGKILKRHDHLALVNLQTTKDVEEISGFASFITGRFAENGINIIEFLSCWTDNLFIIKREDLPKALSILDFAPSKPA